MYKQMKQKTFFRRTAAALTIALLLFSGLVPLSGARAESADIETGQVGTITAECTVTLPQELAGKESRITDGLVESYQSFSSGQAVDVDLPSGAQGIVLEWYTLTSRYTLTQYDKSGAVLSEDAASPYLNAYYPLKEGAARATIAFSGAGSLSTLAVYGAGELPAAVQRWNTAERADLLVIASSPITALDEFFGVIATYACNHDIPTALAVMSPGTRSAQQEMLSALWYAGYDQYPIFGSFTSVNDGIYGFARNDWGRKPTLSFLTETIAAFQPKVLVTHMDDETAPTGGAQFTGEYTLRAAEDAGVQKIYLASADGGTTLDYSVPLNGCFGKTVQELSADVFAFCISRHSYESALVPGAAFTLAETEVGKDAAGNNLFENIDTSTLGGYAEPTPTPQPTPEPTAEPTPEPEAAEPEVTLAPEPEAQQPAKSDSLLATLGQSPLVLIGIAALGAVFSLYMMLTYGLKKRRRRIRPRAVVLSLVPLLIGLLASGALWFFGSQEAAQAAPAETPAPSMTTEPTEAPVLEATPEPEPEQEAQAETEALAPSANDEFYRQDGDPAEVIVVDEDKGHWEYRTDTLSILIDRVVTEYTNNGGKTYPLVYFVAHIRMREINAFRTVQSADNRNGAGAIKPWILARRNKAVLMITGDNLTESDTQYKSILIRDGKVFLDSGKCDVMAMYPDMTLRILKMSETSANELLMDGVREAFSFGPTMIRDGVYTTEDIDHTPRIANETNPRTGLGMIDPGHFVAIVVDGRQKEYSYGMRLTAFGELFVKEGCLEAYNLDGGVSACMLFMGEQLNRHGNKRVGTVEDTYQRRIPDGLVWGYSDTVPSEDDPIYHRGEG